VGLIRRPSVADVRLEGVSKVFRDGTVAVDDLDLEVPDGSLFVVVGPSGCGKTTLLRLVAGLEPPTDGRIRIGGRDVTEASPRDRDVAMVFQSYALYPHLTAYENIAFGLRSRRIGKEEVDRKVRSAAVLLGLEDALRKRPRSLSGGQRQRVALGRAIVREPQVFLMDEPLSDVDARMRDQMRTELARIQRLLGVTTLYVTHDQHEALTLGQRIAVMDRGVVRQVGAPRELYDRPEDLFVAAFLGGPPMNLAEATVERSDGRAFVRFGPYRLPLDAGGGELPAGRQVVFGVRPEHLRPARPSDDPGSVLSVHVERHERIGAEDLLRFRVDAPLLMVRDPRTGHGADGDPWAAERPNSFVARVHEDRDREGTAIDLFVDMRRAHLFDPATGLRLA
jgi:multiple sugar transport system ATP-binding protein